MNFMEKLFSVTCILAIVSQHIASSAQDQDPKPPKILSLTFSPPGPLLEGTEVNATARITSTLGKPDCSWIVFDARKSIKDSLTVQLHDNEYESTVSLGPISRKSDVFLVASNINFQLTDTKHIEFEFDAEVGEPCKTSQQCLLLSSNSECNPEKKVCFCEPGYGLDYETQKETTCKKLPFHRMKKLKFEEGIDMDCKVYYPNVKEINWFRDGTLCAYGSSCSQDGEMRYDKHHFYFQRRLWLFNVYANHTYTCQVTTTDGQNWTVTENQVEVGIKFDLTRHMVPGSNSSIYCALETSRFQIRLVRDGKDFCTPDTTWCKQLEPTKVEGGNNLWFDVFNLRTSHTFTCEAYDGNEKQGTMSVFYFLIGEVPKINELTFSPLGIPLKGTEVVATARILSPSGQPVRLWKLSYLSDQQSLKENVTILPDNIFESRASLGPIRPGNTLSLQVSNSFGKDEKEIKLSVGVGYFDWCDRTAVCAINNTECSTALMRCECRHGYDWDSSAKICRQDAELLQPCVISAQCRSVQYNRECDPGKKKCYCTMASGLDYEENNKNCKYYPFRKVKFVKFEEHAHLKCQVLVPNSSDISWFRTGHELCTKEAAWCSQDETTTYNEELFFYSRNLTVQSVIRNATYTCQANASDGRTWDVSETEVVVVPNHESTTYLTFGEDHNLTCTVTTANLEVRLVRDGKEACTPGATWCSQINDTWATQKSTTFFDILNQRANSTYSCDAYRDNEKLATVAVYHILIDSKPKILELTLSHPGPVQKGTEVVANARFYSPLERPDCTWALNNQVRDLKCEMLVLTEKIYVSKVSLGPIDRPSDVSFSIRTTHGEVDSKIIKVDTSAGAMQKGGILLIALSILLTLLK